MWGFHRENERGRVQLARQEGSLVYEKQERVTWEWAQHDVLLCLATKLHATDKGTVPLASGNRVLSSAPPRK